MRAKTKVTCFLFLILTVSAINAQTQNERLLKRMPAETELISQIKEATSEVADITAYKYKSLSSKEKILKFYRQLFETEGFKEVKGYAGNPKKQPQTLYTFVNKNKMIMLNILLYPEEAGYVSYFIKFFDMRAPAPGSGD